MHIALSLTALMLNVGALVYVVYLRHTQYQFTVRIRFIDEA